MAARGVRGANVLRSVGYYRDALGFHTSFSTASPRSTPEMKRLTSVAGAVAFALAVGGCAQVESMMPGGGWTTLLDGTKGMENWNPVGDANWRAVDGAIQADQKAGKTPAYLVSKSDYSDFQVRVEF
jgi:hypothetical protein